MAHSSTATTTRPDASVQWQWEVEEVSLKLKDQPGFVSMEVIESADGLTSESVMVWESVEAMEAAHAAVAESKRQARQLYMQEHGITTVIS
jgi:heme-degrading monooxygenase HmoA